MVRARPGDTTQDEPESEGDEEQDGEDALTPRERRLKKELPEREPEDTQGQPLFEQERAAQEFAERTPGVEREDVQVEDGRIRATDRDIATVGQAKRATVGAGIGVLPRRRPTGPEGVTKAKTATPGAGIGPTQRFLEGQQRAREQIEQRFQRRFDVGFEVGEEIRVEQEGGRFVGELTPTGRRRLIATELTRAPEERVLDLGETRQIEDLDKLEFDEEGRLQDIEAPSGVITGAAGLVGGGINVAIDATSTVTDPVGEIGRPVFKPAFGAIGAGARAVEDRTQIVLGPRGQVEKDVGGVAFGAAGAVGDVGGFINEEVVQPSLTTLSKTPTAARNPTVRKLARGAGTGIQATFEIPESTLALGETTVEATQFAGETVTEEGVIPGLTTAAFAGGAVATKTTEEVAQAAQERPVQTLGTVASTAALTAPLSPVRLAKFDVPTGATGTTRARGLRVTAPRIAQGRVDFPGVTVAGLKGKRPTLGTPEFDVEDIDFERLAGQAATTEPVGRFETDVLRRATRGERGETRFQAAEELVAQGAKGGGTLELTKTEDIVRQAEDVPEGAAPAVAEALADIDAEIFGSAAVRAQGVGARRPRDVDIAVEDKGVARQRLGEALEEAGETDLARRLRDPDAKDPVFDIKLKSEKARPGEIVKFGRLAQERLETEEGVKVAPAGEELIKKAGASAFLRGEGSPARSELGFTEGFDVGPEPVSPGAFVRAKDPGDASAISAQLAAPSILDRVRPFKRRRLRKRGEAIRTFREEFEPEIERATATQPPVRTPGPIVSKQQLARLAAEERAEVTLARGGRVDVDVGDAGRRTSLSETRRGEFDPTVPSPSPLAVTSATPAMLTSGVSVAPRDSSATVAQFDSPVQVTQPSPTVPGVDSRITQRIESPTGGAGFDSVTTFDTPGPDIPVTDIPPTDIPPPDTPTTDVPPSPPFFPTRGPPTTTTRTPRLDSEDELEGVSDFDVTEEKEFAFPVFGPEAVLEGDIETLAQGGAKVERETMPPTVTDVIAVGEDVDRADLPSEGNVV